MYPCLLPVNFNTKIGARSIYLHQCLIAYIMVLPYSILQYSFKELSYKMVVNEVMICIWVDQKAVRLCSSSRNYS